MGVFENLLGAGIRKSPEPSVTRQPAALPRSNASSAASSPAASAPLKPAVPAAGDDIWQRGDKYARGALPDETAIIVKPPAACSQDAVAVPVKAHVRNLPAQEKSLVPETVPLELLIAEFKKSQRITLQRVLLLGALAEHWVREQLAKGTALDRATAVKKIRSVLAEARLEKKEARVDLYIRCYWVAVLLGGWRDDSQESRAGANELAFSVVRLFPVLIERQRGSDRWQLIPAYAEAAKALWARAVAEKLPAAIVDREITKILPARTVAIRKHRPIRLSVISKLLARLKPEDLPKVHGLVDQVSAKLAAA